MLRSRVLAEFSDYRAYVSHTLCKHRLFLGLGSVAGARRRFDDAAVWPLLRDEAIRLLDHSGTLFGLVSNHLDRKISQEIKNALADLGGFAEELKAGREEVFGVLDEQAKKLRDGLSSIGTLMTHSTPNCSQKRVSQFFGEKTRLDCVTELRNALLSQLRPAVENIMDGPDSADAYRRFWPISSEVNFQIRVVIVSGALEETPEPLDEPLRRAQRDVQHIERVVSCWSPAIPEETRPQKVENALQATGLSSRDSVVDLVEKIAGYCEASAGHR